MVILRPRRRKSRRAMPEERPSGMGGGGVTERLKPNWLTGIAIGLAAIAISFEAAAADLLPSPPPSPGSPPPPPIVAPLPNAYDPYRYEFRFGAFMHGV